MNFYLKTKKLKNKANQRNGYLKIEILVIDFYLNYYSIQFAPQFHFFYRKADRVGYNLSI
jgi:hypothetical protein